MGFGSRPGMWLYQSRGRKPRDVVSFVAVLLPLMAVAAGYVILLAWGVRSLAAHLEIAKAIQVYFWIVAFVFAFIPDRRVQKVIEAEITAGVAEARLRDNALTYETLELNSLFILVFFLVVAFWPSTLPPWMVPESSSLQQEKSWTQEDKENLIHGKRSSAALKKFLTLLDDASQTATPSPTDCIRALDLLKEALEEGKLVRDDVLAKVHADYPKMYREKYMAALEQLWRVLMAEHDEADLIQAVNTANRLLKEFDDWECAHRKAVIIDSANNDLDSAEYYSSVHSFPPWRSRP
jgi:hypothetical protein